MVSVLVVQWMIRQFYIRQVLWQWHLLKLPPLEVAKTTFYIYFQTLPLEAVYSQRPPLKLIMIKKPSLDIDKVRAQDHVKYIKNISKSKTV